MRKTVYAILLPFAKMCFIQARLLSIKIFWQGDREKNKYRLVKWNVVCRPKDMGGLVFMTLKSKTQPYLESVFSTFLLRMVYGRTSLRESTLARSVIPNHLEIWGLALLGRPNGNEEVFLQIWYFFPLRMDRRYGYGRTLC
jgi:hypothetical protein